MKLPPTIDQPKGITVITQDDFALAATCFEPAAANGKVVLIGGATAVYQKFYAPLAAYLAGEDYLVYTFDYRGIGDSRPASLKAFDAKMQDWGALDLDAMIAYIAARHRAAKLIYIGHSVGGQLVALTPKSRLFHKVVLIASQLSYWKLWPAWSQLPTFLLMQAVLPGTSRLFGYYPGRKLKLFHDLPKGVALEWALWCRSRNGLLDHHTDEIITSLQMPLLAYSFSDDLVAPKKAVDALLIKYERSQLDRRHYTPSELGMTRIGHFGFFRDEHQGIFWTQMLAWLKRPMVSKQ
jgi:predicted alpha/beta hydrolase